MDGWLAQLLPTQCEETAANGPRVTLRVLIPCSDILLGLSTPGTKQCWAEAAEMIKSYHRTTSEHEFMNGFPPLIFPQQSNSLMVGSMEDIFECNQSMVDATFIAMSDECGWRMHANVWDCSPHVWGPQIVRPEPRVLNLSPGLAISSGFMELGMPSGHSTVCEVEARVRTQKLNPTGWRSDMGLILGVLEPLLGLSSFFISGRLGI